MIQMNVNYEATEKACDKPKKTVLDELEEDIKRQITFCTNEAEGTVNNDKCWMAVNYLKHLLNKIQELKKEME